VRERERERERDSEPSQQTQIDFITTTANPIIIDVRYHDFNGFPVVKFFRVQLGAALAKAAATRFVQDSVDDGLPIRVLYEHNSASQAPNIPDLPLYHMPS
jgi:hypothetical protein